MIGIFPIKVFWCWVCNWSSPSLITVLVISTYKGAEYLQNKNSTVSPVSYCLSVQPWALTGVLSIITKSPSAFNNYTWKFKQSSNYYIFKALRYCKRLWNNKAEAVFPCVYPLQSWLLREVSQSGFIWHHRWRCSISFPMCRFGEIDLFKLQQIPGLEKKKIFTCNGGNTSPISNQNCFCRRTATTNKWKHSKLCNTCS